MNKFDSIDDFELDDENEDDSNNSLWDGEGDVFLTDANYKELIDMMFPHDDDEDVSEAVGDFANSYDD